MAQHLIHSQKLDLRYTRLAQAKADLDDWGARYQREWLPVLAQVLDELDTSGKWIRLDRVEIDLGKIWENFDPADLKEKLKEAFKNQLLKQLQSNQNTAQQVSGLTNGTSTSTPPQDKKKPLELLEYLLRHGCKPWWASHSKKEGIQSLVQLLMAENSRELVAWMREGFFTPAMVFRLNQQLKWKEIRKLISLILPEKLTEWSALSERLLAALSPEIYPKNELAQKLEGHILDAFLLSDSKLSDPVSQWLKVHLFKSASSTIAPEAFSPLLAELIPASFKTTSKTKVLEKIWAKWTQNQAKGKAGTIVNQDSRSIQIAKIKFFEAVNSSLDNSGILLKERLLKESRKSFAEKFNSEKMALDESFPISNSGLVLAAPFLTYFFKGLGLVENKQFVSPECQNRAVLFLQALLDDSYEYEESDLLLNKILCGLEPSETIEVRFTPTETEIEEIKNLLDSMVSHWTALKSTSGLSMAKGFFPREGILKRIDKGYQLMVPRISIDILLNRLPWTISIIKLPWMEETLYTEW